MWASVKKVCDENPRSIDQIKHSVTEMKCANMFEAIEEAYKVYLSEVNAKKRALLIWGEPNSGKTMLANEFSKVFITEAHADIDSRFCPTKAHSKHNTQLINIDETNFCHLFRADNISRMKKCLEGNGLYIDVKNKDPYLVYVDAFFFLSSNTLPEVSQYDTDSPRYKNEWKPMLERIAIVEFKHQFDSEIDRPAFDYIDICHVWTQMKQKQGTLQLEQAPERILGKRVTAPVTERPAFMRLNDLDMRMGTQTYLTSNISSSIPTPNASIITDA